MRGGHIQLLGQQQQQHLNKANIIHIPKKEGAESIGDYIPISLIHDIVKIITKVLALTSRLSSMTSSCPVRALSSKDATSMTTSYMPATSREDSTVQNLCPAAQIVHLQSLRFGVVGVPYLTLAAPRLPPKAAKLDHHLAYNFHRRAYC
jgi:hypothetical protein